MNRKRRIIIPFLAILLAVLVLEPLAFIGFRPTEEGARLVAERAVHYGPSETVYRFQEGLNHYALGRSGDCISLSRTFHFLLWLSDKPALVPIDSTEPISLGYLQPASGDTFYLFGFCADTAAAGIRVTMSDGSIQETAQFYEQLFILPLSLKDNSDFLYIPYSIAWIECYDADGETIAVYDSDDLEERYFHDNGDPHRAAAEYTYGPPALG